eukprot:1601815-Pleurochrysis_carterae.AAC.6
MSVVIGTKTEKAGNRLSASARRWLELPCVSTRSKGNQVSQIHCRGAGEALPGGGACVRAACSSCSAVRRVASWRCDASVASFYQKKQNIQQQWRDKVVAENTGLPNLEGNLELEVRPAVALNSYATSQIGRYFWPCNLHVHKIAKTVYLQRSLRVAASSAPDARAMFSPASTDFLSGFSAFSKVQLTSSLPALILAVFLLRIEANLIFFNDRAKNAMNSPARSPVSRAMAAKPFVAASPAEDGTVMGQGPFGLKYYLAGALSGG